MKSPYFTYENLVADLITWVIDFWMCSILNSGPAYSEINMEFYIYVGIPGLIVSFINYGIHI